MVPEIIDMDMPVEGVFHNLVIVKIKKDYAGQAQKVMNAMWGAGQMMFNKILVITASLNPKGETSEESFSLSNYETLARSVFKNLNPSTNIYFSQGPMDVLDHSCSKLGFGGKMCIDGTAKFEEERDENYEFGIMNDEFDVLVLKDRFDEIHDINVSLLKKQIPCLIISVKKNRKGHVRDLHERICNLGEMRNIKMILYVEHTVDVNDLPTALWRFCNNLDPKRDHVLYKKQGGILNKEQGTNIESGTSSINPGSYMPAGRHGRDQTSSSYFACMGFDGTRKTKEYDDFNRDWPNIIVADDETIKAVDDKWDKLGIGEFIPSPSLKFRSQLYGKEAVVE